MNSDDELDDRLHRHYAAQREGDTRQAPAFGEMLARARAVVAESTVRPVTEVESPPSVAAAPRRVSAKPRRLLWVLAATPLAVAAGVAAILLTPARSADRDFERTVAEWSRVERAIAMPTDGLLAVPGSEFLRRLPVAGSGTGATRRSM
jgi:hypothetical protein